MPKKLSDHTLEKLEISKRLGKVEVTMASIEGNLIRMVGDHEKTLYGNNGQAGLKIHVDRIVPETVLREPDVLPLVASEQSCTTHKEVRTSNDQ